MSPPRKNFKMNSCLECEHSIFNVPFSHGPIKIKCKLSSRIFTIKGPALETPPPDWCEMEIEIWIDVPGYEGLYKVSNMGNILKFKHNHWQPMEQSKNPRGYRSVSLRKNKDNKGFFTHSLVMLAFVGARTHGLVTHHKNEIKDDNRASNLKYITQKENCQLYHAKK